MILKRPSFRRGGNAGIGSITPRVNARFGFGFLRKGMGGDKLFPQKIGTTPSAVCKNPGSGICDVCVPDPAIPPIMPVTRLP